MVSIIEELREYEKYLQRLHRIENSDYDIYKANLNDLEPNEFEFYLEPEDFGEYNESLLDCWV